jgi:hypothetical protein
MSGLSEPLEIALLVAAALEKAGIEYFLGGSVASSLHGQPRFTRDIDFVVHMGEAQVGALVAALGPDFDVDDVALRRAAKERRSWNIFHSPTVFRIDLFILKGSEYDAETLVRRQRKEVAPGRALYVSSAEDIVLRKLLWFKEGGEVSSQQLKDVVEVLRVQGQKLQQRYLDVWAPRLGIEALLKKARQSVEGAP